LKPLKRKKGSKSNRAVFLDRDGTLIRDMSYLSDPAQTRLYRGAGDAVRNLRREGYRVIVVTNQSGVARGYFKEAVIHRVHRKIQSLLRGYRTKVDAFYYCPHYPEGTVKSMSRVCSCRKPKPGMVIQAVRRFDLDPSRSYMVGDKLEDVLLARTAGLKKGMLVRTGKGKKNEKRLAAIPGKSLVFANLPAAARWILRNSNKKRD
jgi:D-glycero-D-manno-heptose 1,7-bisphosphate phosphatase